MDKNRTKRITKKYLLKLVSVFLMITLLLDLSTLYISADTYYTVRINYLYVDGTHAHDPYIATFPADQPVNVTVTNPNVSGYDPMMLNEGETNPMALPENGTRATTTAVNIDALDHNVTYTVYYLAGLSHYRARFYLQNVYDDLYTTDQTLNAQYQDLLGRTGSFPTNLEEVKVKGFTSLFHEPDAIAADGSTVFRLYYDRNYYTVGFDLGEGGYGVEPIYAKYQTVYHVDEPKRLGYTFRGWARTDIDSAVEGADWHYIDENGNVISEEEATATGNLLTLEGDQTIPAKNTYYKAIWAPGTTSCSVVYWFENADSDLKNTAAEFEGLTEEQIQAKVSQNYSVIAAKDVYNIYDENGNTILIEPGMTITPDTIIRNKAKKAKDEGIYSGSGDDVIPIKDFFSFNLGYADPSDPRNSEDHAFDENGDRKPEAQVYKYDKDGGIIDFNDISQGTSEQLVGNANYFELNTADNTPIPNYRTDTSVTVRGDGMTRINIYFRRKEFTLKFYYAREKISDGTIDLTNSTKAFTRYDYIKGKENALKAVSQGTWQAGIGESKPTLNAKYTDPDSPNYLPYIYERIDPYNGYNYYFYQVKAKFGAPLDNKWLIDAVQSVHKKGYNSEQMCIPGSWAVEYDTNFHYNNIKANGGNDNYTVKGTFEKLTTAMMLRNKSRTNDELHFLLSWTNTSKSNDWNYGMDRVLHFTYNNYVELLDKEVELLKNSNYDTSVLTGEGQPYLDIRQFETVRDGINRTFWYGLTSNHIVETIDSGSQYPYTGKTNGKDKTEYVRSDQTATEMEGFELENYRLNGTKVVLDETNTEVDWSDDTTQNRHGIINFFYRRREYTLKYRNGNRKDESHNRTVKFGAPLNAVYASGEHEGEYRYYWSNPNYYIPELGDNYTFSGWYYTPYYFRQVNVDTATMPANDLTLYAKWSPKKINVVFYNNYNEYYEDTNRIVLGHDEEDNPITDWTVEYGSYVPLNHIPADVHDGESNRPELTPIAEKASFAGWYYIRNRVPRRFEPENVPVTALNAESTGDNAKLRLFAEWVTQDVAKYRVNYVRADDPTVEVAPPTVGRAYVWKTRTFHAKSGDELSDEYKWTEEHEDEGTNWWPTVNSHSIIVKANEEGEDYKPNEYTFEYIQKDKVNYRVRYLDADTSKPINVEGHDIEKVTTHASVKEDARVIPGYIADPSSATLILSASTAATTEEQKAEELRNNVITFLYHKNTTEYIYETEYYTHDLEGDGYSLFASESLEIPIAAHGDTTVAINDIFARPIPQQIIADGFERSPGKAEYTYVAADGSESQNPIPVADNGSVTIVATDKKTIRLYFDRRSYSYSYEYVDHTAAKAYDQAPEAERGNMWNGVLASFPNAGSAPVGSTVILSVPTDYTYSSGGTTTAYTRMTNADGTLNDVKINIQPAPDGSLVNHIRIYYRKDIERDLNYRMVCVNANGETDYDEVTGDPLFGRLSVNRQTVESYNGIQPVTFYSTDNDTVRMGSEEVPVHLHKYEFLGWYTSPEYNENNPAENRITTDAVLTKEALGTDGSLPDRDTKYYALVKQKMVQMDVDFYFCDDYTKTQMYALSDGQMKEYLQQKIDENKLLPSGEYGGKEVIFSSPSKYQNHTQIAWHKNDGYSLYMQDIDNRVYKYEFAEWWEIDEAQNNDLIPKHNWNGGEWSPDSLASQLSRTKNQHLIAVYARREVTELPYTVNYNFTSRTGEEKTYVKKGTLTGEELNENSENTKITKDGFYALTDEFILANAPYESNFAEVLNWSDHPDHVVKDSVKSDGTEGSVDRIVTDVNAVQSGKNVFANFRTAPTGSYTTISIPYGSNYRQSENMLAIECTDTYAGKSFAYWEVRKSENGSVIAKSYDTLFDLCMMDSYWITPVYGSPETPAGDNTLTLDPTSLASGEEDWLTWTWSNGESGTLVFPSQGLVFNGLADNVKFIRVPKGTTTLDAGWTNVWNQTADLDVTYGVNNGGVFKLTGWGYEREMYGEWTSEAAPLPSITLTHIDDTRNTWTDENNEVPANGATDILYTDFEIAFDEGTEEYIFNAPKDTYRTGVVFELCATLPAGKAFEPGKDYGLVSNENNLKAAILNNAATYNYNPDKPEKMRNLQISEIPQSALTNRDRVQYGKSYRNTYKYVNEDKTYINARYLLKATAYLVRNGEVTLSNSVYICLAAEADKDLAIDSGIVSSTNNG